MYVNKIIMLDTLNLYSAICQLYINKTGRKKISKNMARFRQLTGWKHSFIHSLIQQVNDYYQKTAFICQFWEVTWEKHWKLPVNFRVFQMV